MHIAVDMDDVLVEFYSGVVASIEKEFGVVADWDGAPWGPKAVYLSNEHPVWKENGYENWWGWLRARDWLWAGFDAVDGAIGGMQTLRTQGHFVEIVTSKPEWAEHIVWKWLGKWRPPADRVSITKPGQRKVEHTGADLIIDDKYETCEDFVNAGRHAVWFDRGTGGFDSDRLWSGVWRANGWPEVLTLLGADNDGAQVTSLHP